MGLQTTGSRFDPYKWFASTLAALFSYDLDPSRRLLVPEADDAHTTEWLTLSTLEHAIPAHLFRPKRATGAAVVFGHGIGVEMPLPYFRIIETLLRRGITVLTYELDGHGDNPRDLTYPTCLSCVPTVLRSLRRIDGIDPDRIGYFGMSMGGVVGIRAAVTAPWLKAMVLMATPLRVEVSDWSRLQETLGLVHPLNTPALADASLDHMMRCFFNPVRFGPETVHTLLDPPFYAVAGDLIRDLDPLAHARQLPNIPTRLIQGEWDTIVPPKSAYELLEALPGPADLVMMPRKNHFTILLHRQAAIAAAEWFEQHL